MVRLNAVAMSQKLACRNATSGRTERSISRSTSARSAGEAWAAAASPSGRRPRSAGWRRMKSSTGGRTIRASSTPSTANACRQPKAVTRRSASGANTIPPAEMPAVAMRSAWPRRRTNQRATAELFGSGPMQVRAERDGTGEAEVERGERVHAREHEEAHRQHERAHDLDRACAVAVDGAADEQRVAGGSELQDREAARHRRVSAEGLGQRPEEDAPGVEDHAGVDGVADEGHQHDPPAVEDASVLPYCRCVKTVGSHAVGGPILLVAFHRVSEDGFLAVAWRGGRW